MLTIEVQRKGGRGDMHDCRMMMLPRSLGPISVGAFFEEHGYEIDAAAQQPGVIMDDHIYATLKLLDPMKSKSGTKSLKTLI
jgi:hypothetical protein